MPNQQLAGDGFFCKIKEIKAGVRDVVARAMTDKVLVQATLHEQIFFVCTDGIVRHQLDDRRFSTLVEIPGAEPGMDVSAQPEVVSVSSFIAPDQTSIREKVIVDVFAKVTRPADLSVALDPLGGVPILAGRVVGTGEDEVLTSTTIALDPPAVKISDVRAEVVEASGTVGAGLVSATGTVQLQVFYVAADSANRHASAILPFSVDVEVPGAVPGQEARVTAAVRTVSYDETFSGPLFPVEVLVDVEAKALESGVFTVALGGGPTVQVEQVLGEGDSQVLVGDSFSLTQPASDIVEIVAVPQNVSPKVIDGKVIVQGQIGETITLLSSDGTTTFTEQRAVPFSDFVRIPEAVAGADATVETTVVDVTARLETATTFVQDITIALAVTVTQTTQIEIDLDPSGPLLAMDQEVGSNTTQVLVEKVVPPRPRISRIPIAAAQAVSAQLQMLVEADVALDHPAVRIKSAEAAVHEALADMFAGQTTVILHGKVSMDISYVGTDGIVRARHAQVGFSGVHTMDRPAVATQTVPTKAEIEGKMVKLRPGGTLADMLVIVRDTFTVEEAGVTVMVVKDVTGPGIAVKKFVKVGSDGAFVSVLQDIAGPSVLAVKKQTIVVNHLEDSTPVFGPVVVVEDVTLAPT